MPTVLLLAATTGYQTRAFGDAAERLGVELVFATDRCHMLEDPWQDGAIAVRFHEADASAAAIVELARTRPIDGILAVGDRPTAIAALVAAALGLPWHPPAAAAIARSKQLTRERLAAAGLPAPRFEVLAADRASVPPSIRYPCVVKPLALSGSRGVMRADDEHSLREAVERLRALLASADVQVERNALHDRILIEDFIPGRELAVEALLNHGALHPLAIFDKPDPLDGPFFEETIYVTPSVEPADVQAAIVDAVARAAAAIGLRHGPIHAECRVNADGVFVLEIAARPIGGLCARALTVQRREGHQAPDPRPFPELLLLHALGEDPANWRREDAASGVMMIPIARRGVYRGVSGIDDARRVAGVEDVQITAKPEQLLVPLPEGASYLGFIFARAGDPRAVDRALRAAHARLRFAIAPEVPVLQSAHG